MTRLRALMRWLDDKSDWFSPILVKEVRQVVRGREFNYSFGGTLLVALAMAFFGAVEALSGSTTAGRWTFGAFSSFLAFLGLAVVPLGAFSALRNERLEQTLDLITLTALSARRIVVGKLLAHAVKLSTLFAAMAPFIAMSFLLGGIDFTPLLVMLAVLFLWSVWMCAACLFLSTLLKSRAMSGLVFGAMGIVLLLLFAFSRFFFMVARGGMFFGPMVTTGPAAGAFWWTLAIVTTFCVASAINLVLLTENRLSLATEDRVTSVRIGFLAQFLLIIGWCLSYVGDPVPVRLSVLRSLGVFGALHLALVAMFAVTEDLTVPRRVLQRIAAPSRWRWLLAMFRPGGGRGAIYVLAQMGLLLLVPYLFEPPAARLRWILAACGYICFFTGVPTALFRLLRPTQPAALTLRVAVLILFAGSLVLPDVLHSLFGRQDVLNLSFSYRHLVNPIRTLANWTTVERNEWFSIPFSLGVAGLLAYVLLIRIGLRTTTQPAAIPSASSVAAAGQPGSANVLY